MAFLATNCYANGLLPLGVAQQKYCAIVTDKECHEPRGVAATLPKFSVDSLFARAVKYVRFLRGDFQMNDVVRFGCGTTVYHHYPLRVADRQQ